MVPVSLVECGEACSKHAGTVAARPCEADQPAGLLQWKRGEESGQTKGTIYNTKRSSLVV